MKNLKVGDVVVLKSGGPKMTINSEDYSEIWCHWFNNGEVKVAKFVEEQLEVYNNHDSVEAFDL